ncbi:hypothetical protein PVAP13_6KG355406 [Panicum virgatum]|uniref:Uncharacterized protein n=1 Tax=Panicum virgatum TaxID=38727 RepID=A0A8T0RJF4_PANVG|nr:hypothetical protein PVAP13_6KG355406 [Panicum virgatum]
MYCTGVGVARLVLKPLRLRLNLWPGQRKDKRRPNFFSRRATAPQERPPATRARRSPSTPPRATRRRRQRRADRLRRVAFAGCPVPHRTEEGPDPDPAAADARVRSVSGNGASARTAHAPARRWRNKGIASSSMDPGTRVRVKKVRDP